jgi:hypothetical protein
MIRCGALLSDLWSTIAKPEDNALAPIQERMVSPSDEDPSEILFHHSILCQTSIPYLDPGEATREWLSRNGRVFLHLQAGSVFNPADTFVRMGLPYGPKPRLVLYQLNSAALRTGSPMIEIGNLTHFVKILGLDPTGRNIHTVRDQLLRLSAATLRLGYNAGGDRAVTIKASAIDGIEIWVPGDPGQAMLWPTRIHFSQPYFESLMTHAVPLNPEAIARLSNSPLALDVYCWLAQRLHRVDPQGELLSWNSLERQFGQGYKRSRDFRRFFTKTLSDVQVVYPNARFTLNESGMQLSNSPPPVVRRHGRSLAPGTVDHSRGHGRSLAPGTVDHSRPSTVDHSPSISITSDSLIPIEEPIEEQKTFSSSATPNDGQFVLAAQFVEPPEPQPVSLGKLQETWFVEEFWPIFWRKEHKPESIKAFKKHAISEEIKNQIVSAEAAHAPMYMLRDSEYRPLAATWLNKERWRDTAIENRRVTAIERWNDKPAQSEVDRPSTGPNPSCAHCSGTGWRIVERGGKSGAIRCDCWGTRETARECSNRIECANLPTR